MTRSEEEYVIQQLVDSCRDLTLKGIGEAIGTTETQMHWLYHWTWKKSLTIGMEKRLHDLVEKKIKILIKIIKFMEKHQSPIRWETF